MAEWVIGGNLDQDDPDAVGVLYPHLDQAPRLCCWLSDDRDSGGGEPNMLRVDISYLDPDHHRTPWRGGCMSGDLEETGAEKEHRTGIFRRAELSVDGQAHDVAVEATAAVQVAGAQENPAAQNVHATI
jgi:hypothetical protein